MKTNVLVSALVLIMALLIAGYEHRRISKIIHVYLPVFLENETNAIAIQLRDSLRKSDNLSNTNIPLTVFPSVSIRIEMKRSKQVRIINATNSHLAPPQWFVNWFMRKPLEYQMSFYNESEKRATIYTAMMPNALLREAWMSFLVSVIFFGMMYIALSRLTASKEKLLELLTFKVLSAFKQVKNNSYEHQLEMGEDLLVNQVMSEFDSVITHQKQQYKELLHEKNKFENLTQYDELTGLANKQCFHNMMTEKLREKDGLGGHILLLKLSSLDQINIQLGRQEGDIYISRMANVLNKLCNVKNVEGHVFRNLGSEMLVIILNADSTMIDLLAEELKNYLSRLDNDRYQNGCGYFSIIQFKPRQKLTELMISLDCNLSQAMAKYHNSYMIAQPDEVVVGGLNNWYKKIDEIIKTKNITLHQYIIELAHSNIEPYRYEVYASFDIKTETYAAKDVFSAAKRFNVSHKIDQLVITKLIEFLENDENDETDEDNERYAIKVSCHSITNERFRNWLSHLLSHHRTLAKRLVFQIQEQIISEQLDASRLFINLVHKADSNVVLECENQTNAIDVIDKIKSLSIDMVRVRNQNVQPNAVSIQHDSFINTLVTSAHKNKVPVIVGHVESQQVWNSLILMGVDAGQGLFFGQPVTVTS
jgi:diguanylate cyclase (GGDEF)-like protein